MGTVTRARMGEETLPVSRSSLLLAAASLLAIAVTPGAAFAQSMVEELAVLLDSHPLIKAKSNLVSGSAEAVSAARAGYLPTVKLTGDTGPEYVNSPTRRQTEGESFFKGRETVGVVVTQRLFDGFATDSAVESAKLTQAYYQTDLRDTRQTTLLQGIRAYINVLRFNRLIQLARENERKVQDQMNLEDERVIKGSGIASDVLAAKQRLQMAKEARVDFEGQLAVTATYQQLYATPPTSPPFPTRRCRRRCCRPNCPRRSVRPSATTPPSPCRTRASRSPTNAGAAPNRGITPTST